MHKFNLFLALLVGAGLAATGPQADADVAPYGGCDESWRYVKSEGADWCRAHGWTVRNRVLIDNHGVSREIVLPACRFEDGSRQRDNCVEHGDRINDGTRPAFSYWIHQGAREAGKPVSSWLHYFWTADPRVAAGDRWVSTDEDRELDSRYSPKDWNDCYVTASPVRADIRCADGTRVASR